MPIIPAEEKYVRRSKGAFARGAKPIKSGSHRMKKLGVFVTPELQEAINALAEEGNHKQSEWLRAAIRKAIREGVDVDCELETPIDFEPPSLNKGP